MQTVKSSFTTAKKGAKTIMQQAKKNAPRVTSRELSTKQKRFIEVFNGNATEAAKTAGYSEKNAGRIGGQLMNNPRIIAAIQAREKERNEIAIATREERQKLFTEIMRDRDENTKDRLRACELLGKSEGDFIERQEVTGKNGAPLLPGEPLEINIQIVDCFTDDNGSVISREKNPSAYAAAWLKDHFKENGRPGELEAFCAAIARGELDALAAGHDTPCGHKINI